MELNDQWTTVEICLPLRSLEAFVAWLDQFVERDDWSVSIIELADLDTPGKYAFKFKYSQDAAVAVLTYG